MGRKPGEMMTFIAQISEQLSKMSEKEKDEWILSQAKLVEDSEHQDFLLTLSGEKKIIYMPSQKEIEEFCEKVARGEICLEYETHYYEFDDDGRYMDDWKKWHNDPLGAMPFMNRVFNGCHDLLILGEYRTAADTLDRVCRLEFKVVESENSEDFEDDSPFTVADAAGESMLSMELCEIGTDWITSVVRMTDKWDSSELAKILVRIFEHPVCRKINPTMLIEEDVPKDLFSCMLNVLNMKISDLEITFDKMFSETEFSYEKYLFEKKMKRIQEIALNIRLKCMEQASPKPQQKIPVLASSWKQIKELLEQLRYERYIDDQWEIEEVGKICGALIRRGGFGQEEWNLRKDILSDIIRHGYYDHYGCYDPMFDLSERLCTRSEEYLGFADILDEYYCYEEKAAYLYHQYGRDDKYISYLETHLEKKSKTYVALIDYYRTHDNMEGARWVAEQGLEKCKDDLTDIFIFLLADAKNNKEEDRYKKFFSSAKRRKAVDIVRINEALNRCG